MLELNSVVCGPAELLAMKSQHLLPGVRHFFKRPPHIVRGEGALLFDHEGASYVDCIAGVGVMNAGHGNSAIIEPAIEQIRTLQHTTSILLTEPVLRLAERLATVVPVDNPRFFFCASGSEAVEFALLIATQSTDRRIVIAAHDGLHGRTRWAMSATGIPMWRSDPFPMDNRVRHVPFNDVPALRHAMETLRGQVAAFIAEPVQGNGGINVPDEAYWPAVRELCDEHGVFLIADEVQTGFNRTGCWFASEHWGLRPDIVCMSKGLGNGFPIAAIAVKNSIAKKCTSPAASTYGGNPVSAAAALASIEFHAAHDLAFAARERGMQLARGLERAVMNHPGLFGRPRGIGLMRAVPVIGVPELPSDDRCDAMLESLKDFGVLAGKSGRDRNILTFMPPLVLTFEQVERVLVALEQAAMTITGTR